MRKDFKCDRCGCNLFPSEIRKENYVSHIVMNYQVISGAYANNHWRVSHYKSMKILCSMCTRAFFCFVYEKHNF